MPPQEAAEIERRLDEGAWLRTGDVAVLFEATRQDVDHWIGAGKFRYRRTPGGHRLLHPEDVRRELDAFRVVHGGESET